LRRIERIARAVPGLQYAVTNASGLRFAHEVGVADARDGRPVTQATLFMAASCTKVVTAAAIQALVDAGRIDLDGGLSEVYPDHPYGKRITIRQLLEHTAGVPNPLPVNWLHRLDDAGFDEDRALAAVLTAHPRLRHEPGQRYGYSNLGYWLLGKAIERVTGSGYTRYVEETLFAPLAIPRDELTFSPADPAGIARGYERAWSPMGVFARIAVRRRFRDGRDGSWLRFARVGMNGPAYGGLFATARGFCAFLRGQLSRLDQVPLGWRVGVLGSARYLGKPGGGPGFCGNVRLYPALGLGTAWFANRMEVSEAKIVALADQIDRPWVD
jgi:CubicO group peptidase (beta-lactamase class C family)